MEVAPKYEYGRHIPHSIARAFGLYCGYGMEASNRCVDRCFDEFAASALDPHHYVSQQLFNPERVVAQQLDAFRKDPILELRQYPDAFIEIRARAFHGKFSERYTEKEHKDVKVTATRGLRFSEPAYCCAKKRKPQLETMLATPRQRGWILQRWNDRTIVRQLLEHKLDNKSVDMSTTAQLHAKVYGYERTQMFATTAA